MRKSSQQFLAGKNPNWFPEKQFLLEKAPDDFGSQSVPCVRIYVTKEQIPESVPRDFDLLGSRKGTEI